MVLTPQATRSGSSRLVAESFLKFGFYRRLGTFPRCLFPPLQPEQTPSPPQGFYSILARSQSPPVMAGDLLRKVTSLDKLYSFVVLWCVFTSRARSSAPNVPQLRQKVAVAASSAPSPHDGNDSKCLPFTLTGTVALKRVDFFVLFFSILCFGGWPCDGDERCEAEGSIPMRWCLPQSNKTKLL